MARGVSRTFSGILQRQRLLHHGQGEVQLPQYSRTTRKPTEGSLIRGTNMVRLADRARKAGKMNEPPRDSRSVPVCGPWGSDRGEWR